MFLLFLILLHFVYNKDILEEVGVFGRQRGKVRRFWVGFFLRGLLWGFVVFVLVVLFCFFKGTYCSMTEQCIKLQMGCGNWLQTSVFINVREYGRVQRIYQYSSPVPTQTRSSTQKGTKFPILFAPSFSRTRLRMFK